MNANINQFIRKDIVDLKSYVPGVSAAGLAKTYNQTFAKLTKLNANENPYGVSPVVRQIIQNTFYNYYPDSGYSSLRKEIAKYAGVKSKNIIVGSGSDELIDMLLRLVLSKKDKAIICSPTFGMYQTLTQLNKGVVIDVTRNKDFSINVPAIIKKSKSKRVKVIFICNPNNPTGTLTPPEELAKILDTEKIVIVDEAYFEFGNITASPLLSKYPNLIIIRTFSKWAGLAGLRIGYAIASELIADQIMKIKLPYNVNASAEAAAIATLRNMQFAKKCVKKIISERKIMFDSLKNMTGIHVYLSYGNFIFLQVKNRDEFNQLQKRFEAEKIALRYYPALNNGIRITIGRPEQNKKMFSIFNNFFEMKKYAFIDRDGTLIYEPQDTFQIDSLDKLKMLDGVIDGLKKLKNQKYELAIISNQDNLGTKNFPISSFIKPQKELLNIFKKNGIEFSKILICPHSPLASCKCRKPKTGLVDRFVNTIDKNNSLMIGDRETDSKFAKNLGIKFIKMKTNDNFYKAVKII